MCLQSHSFLYNREYMRGLNVIDPSCNFFCCKDNYLVSLSYHNKTSCINMHTVSGARQIMIGKISQSTFQHSMTGIRRSAWKGLDLGLIPQLQLSEAWEIKYEEVFIVLRIVLGRRGSNIKYLKFEQCYIVSLVALKTEGIKALEITER